VLRKDSTATLVGEVPEAPFYIPGTGSSTRPRRTLTHGDSFVVLDSHDFAMPMGRIRRAVARAVLSDPANGL